MNLPFRSFAPYVWWIVLLFMGVGSGVAEEAESAASQDRIRIAVYEGQGAGASRTDLLAALEKATVAERFDVVSIGPESIREGALDGVDVLMHPGGSGGGQAKALGETGREAVRDFVRGGGGFVGVCAGAYLATNHYSWSLGLIDAKVVDTKHWARGKGIVELELSPAAVAFFGEDAAELSIYYGQGPLLSRQEWDDPEAPEYESLAVYRSEIAEKGAPKGVMQGTSAMVRAEYGEGPVFAFSPHPEKTDGLEHLVERAVLWAAGVEQDVRLPTAVPE